MLGVIIVAYVGLSAALFEHDSHLHHRKLFRRDIKRAIHTVAAVEAVGSSHNWYEACLAQGVRKAMIWPMHTVHWLKIHEIGCWELGLLRRR